MPTDIVTLERICAEGWPGTRSRSSGDWLARFGNGFSQRANSVLVLGEPSGPVEVALRDMTEWYAGFGRRPVFQLPTGDGLPPEIPAVDTHLRDAGWQIGDRVSVQAAAIEPVLAWIAGRSEPAGSASGTTGPDTTVSAVAAPGAEWLALYHYRGQPLPPAAVEILAAGPDPAFLTVYRDGTPVGVGRGIVVRGWLGITAVTVPEQARRSGVGTAVMTALLQWGLVRGAHSAYLQVDRANSVALKMYERLGFTEHHGYHYLLAPA